MPGKPSLISSYRTNNYEGEGGSYSEVEYEQVNRSPARRPKSVTFDKEPPDVLHYEMVTPDPSVEGSPATHYDSDEDEEDEDELEYTAVIEPDHWERISPEDVVPASFEDAFRSTPSPSARPLPPIPGVFNPRRESGSPSGSRPLPSIPVTKADLESLEKVPLEERVRLMMQEDIASYEQPSRRRSTEPSREKEGEDTGGLGIMMDDSDREAEVKHDICRQSVSPAQLEESDTSDNDETSPSSNRDPEIESGSSSHYESASEYEPPPRLSRESIRRQVEARREHSFDSQQTIEEHEVSKNDTYLYGQENNSIHEAETQIKQEHSDDDSIDVYAIPDMYHLERPASRFNTRSPDLSEVTRSEASRYDDDDNESRYSEVGEDENAAETTPIPSREEFTPTPTKFQPSIALEKGELIAGQQMKEGVVQEGTNVEIAPDDPRMSLPEFSSIFGDEGLGLTAYMTPSPPLLPVEAPKPEPLGLTPSSELAPSSGVVREFFAQRLEPLEDQLEPASDEVIADDEEDTGSVIRHKIYHSDIEEDEDEDFDSSEDLDDGELSDTDTIQAARSPSPVAESIATIRVPSGMLKTRASATPADMAAMAAARRHVSGEIRIPPPVPRIPKTYHSEGEPSLSSDDEDDIPEGDVAATDEESERKFPEKKRKSIGLPALGEFEFDLKLDDLTEEFDRVIETQKVLQSPRLLEIPFSH